MDFKSKTLERASQLLSQLTHLGLSIDEGLTDCTCTSGNAFNLTQLINDFWNMGREDWLKKYGPEYLASSRYYPTIAALYDEFAAKAADFSLCKAAVQEIDDTLAAAGF